MKQKILFAVCLMLAFALGAGFSYAYLQKPCPNIITAGKSTVTVSFNDLTELDMQGATSKDVLVECYDPSHKVITPKSVKVDRFFKVVVQFSGSTSGYCIMHNTK